jgi:uncharacterized membrane protein YqjE
VFTSLRRMFSTSLELVENRFQLFALELQEEKIRLLDLVLCAAAAVAFGFMALIAVSALIVVWLWDTSPVAVLGILALLYALVAIGLVLSIRSRLERGPTPFAGTMAEFRKDRECFSKHD